MINTTIIMTCSRTQKFWQISLTRQPADQSIRQTIHWVSIGPGLHLSWVTGFSGKTPHREMRGYITQITNTQHPRSHRGRYAAFLDMRISLLIWSSDYLLPTLRGGGEGTVDWDTVASNCSTGNHASNFNKGTSSNSSNWELWARWGLPTVNTCIHVYIYIYIYTCI